jgi:hypothetical protein
MGVDERTKKKSGDGRNARQKKIVTTSEKNAGTPNLAAEVGRYMRRENEGTVLVHVMDL